MRKKNEVENGVTVLVEGALLLHAIEPANTARVARLFKTAWRRVPAAVRTALISNWRVRGPARLLLEERWGVLAPRTDDVSTAVGKGALVMRAAPSFIDTSSDPLVIALLGFLLAEAWLVAGTSKSPSEFDDFLATNMVVDWRLAPPRRELERTRARWIATRREARLAQRASERAHRSARA